VDSLSISPITNQRGFFSSGKWKIGEAGYFV